MEQISEGSVMNSLNGMSVARLDNLGPSDASVTIGLSSAAVIDGSLHVMGGPGRQEAKRQQVVKPSTCSFTPTRLLLISAVHLVINI